MSTKEPQKNSVTTSYFSQKDTCTFGRHSKKPCTFHVPTVPDRPPAHLAVAPHSALVALASDQLDPVTLALDP